MCGESQYPADGSSKKIWMGFFNRIVNICKFDAITIFATYGVAMAELVIASVCAPRAQVGVLYYVPVFTTNSIAI
jgi:hypothetical protein